jgi:hypothetical protein
MDTTPLPSSSRTVVNHSNVSTATPSQSPATPSASSDSKRIILSAPTDITTPIRPPAGFPLSVPRNTASTSTNGTPSAYRGVKLDQIAERQANATGSGIAPGLSAKALGKRKRTAEEEEIIYRAGLV